VIALDGVAKSYPTALGRKVVLDDATIDFAAGHNFGILGANGSGKSTLIRLLAGSELPDRGTIRRRARVSFPLGFGGTFHGAIGRNYVAVSPTEKVATGGRGGADCSYMRASCMLDDWRKIGKTRGVQGQGAPSWPPGHCCKTVTALPFQGQ
jgi:energy-coupling factor transporter ATP-binding protein EcfA2